MMITFKISTFYRDTTLTFDDGDKIGRHSIFRACFNDL